MNMLRFCLVTACAFYLGGCSEYLDRRDTIRRSSGEAVQHNIATHVIDPWPKQAFVDPKTTSGERAQRAVERYRNPGAGSGSGSAQTALPVIRGGDQGQARLF